MAATPNEAPGAEDFVDPAPSVRLSRKNILGLVLTVVGVILALFFSSRRSPAPRSAERVPEAPGYGSLAPITIGTPDLAIPAPEATPAPGTWSSTPAQPSARQIRGERQRARYDEARRARPLLHISDGALDEDAAEPAKGTFTVRESTVIEAALETALHSKRPGPVLARVVRPVRDSEHLNRILIPAGTKLTGSMQQVVSGGSGRVVVAWTRMEFPDGRTKALPALPAIESSGEHGLRDQANRHRARTFGSAALLALLGGSTTYATAQTGAAGSLAGASLAMELSRTAGGVLQQNMGRAPTVTVRPGYRFLIYVSEDLHFDAPYQ